MYYCLNANIDHMYNSFLFLIFNVDFQHEVSMLVHES